VAEERHLSGTAFGTTWSVTWVGTQAGGHPEVIGAILAEADRTFSTWRPDSEISRFNRHAAGHPFKISPVFAHVLDIARDVHARSGGVFDPTVGPLVSAFGFGPRDAADPDAVPCFDAVAWNHERLELTKTVATATLDLSGIAKGHAVDQVVEALRAEGTDNLLVEIGGELRGVGAGPDRQGWPVGVQRPGDIPGMSGQIIRLRDEAAATSGTYWQKRDLPQGPVNHIIDPRTRKPVGHDTVSVTVIAATTAVADAWATALLVLGSEEGKRVAEREGIEAMFLRRPDPSASAPAVTNRPLGRP